MKITKAQGRACLRKLEQVSEKNWYWCPNTTHSSWLALDELTGGWGTFSEDFSNTEHYLTALAMCAAIAGVKP